MTNNLTELVFILDESGSMYSLKSDTIGGFNSMIEKQKGTKGECLVSTVLFNTERKVVHDRVSLKEIKPMTNRDYLPSGCTALLDAIGFSIKHIGNIHKYARKEDVPNQTIFVIMTDGFENASHFFSSSKIKEMINHQKEKYNWDFMFIGANIDAETTAKEYGITKEMAVNYHADEKGTEIVYDSIARAVNHKRTKGTFAPTWRKSMDEDYNSRS